VIVFAILFGILCFLGLSFLALVWFFRRLRDKWDEVGPGAHGKRVAIVLMGIAAIASPYVAFKTWELSFVLARVPDPLHVWWIEYRLEESWGIGLPGDNETGFVVYRLTPGSAQWARSKGTRLGEFLPGGSESWHLTPVDENDPYDRWHRYDQDSDVRPHGANIREYLGQYGFSIPLEKESDTDANRAIRNPGSFYSYGRGGSVTIVDPQRGKVYFAYAG
jgi:hypothetical protein